MATKVNFYICNLAMTWIHQALATALRAQVVSSTATFASMQTLRKTWQGNTCKVVHLGLKLGYKPYSLETTLP